MTRSPVILPFALLCMISLFINMVGRTNTSQQVYNLGISDVSRQYPTPVEFSGPVYNIATGVSEPIDLTKYDYTLLCVGGFVCPSCVSRYYQSLSIFHDLIERNVSVQIVAVWESPSVRYGQSYLQIRGISEHSYLNVTKEDLIRNIDLGGFYAILLNSTGYLLLKGAPKPNTNSNAVYIASIIEHSRKR